MEGKILILKSRMADFCERLTQLKKHEVLVLSTGYEPLFKTCWKRAVSAVFAGRAEVIERHDSLWIGTASGKIKCPTVVRFTTGVIAAKIKVNYKAQRPSKKMLFFRDKGKCQYCLKKVSLSNATIDHVQPRSKGGKFTWENLVIACAKCNGKKSNFLLAECNMVLKSNPKMPNETFLPIVL